MTTTATRAFAGSLATCIAAAGLVLLPAANRAAPALAAPTDPTFTVLDALGQPAADVALNDQIALSGTSPIGAVGQTSQRIATGWDPAQFQLNTGSVVAPEGWTTEYTANGSTWVSSAPPLGTIRGVRSTGQVDSDGFQDGQQVSTTTSTGDLVTGGATFAGTPGGDGWDAIATSTYVLNVWHHSYSGFNMDCHLRDTGEPCGASVYHVDGYRSSTGSSAAVVGTKAYSLVGVPESYDPEEGVIPGSFGILCTDISAVPFTGCGYTPLIAGNGDVYGMGSQTLVGDRLYAPVTASGGELLCFDLDMLAACADQPYALGGLVPLTTGGIPVFSMSDSGKVFVTANELWCFDAATGAACAGSWPVGDFTFPLHPAVPMRDSGGVLTGVCMIYPSNLCYTLAGASAAFPPGLAGLLEDLPVSGGPPVGWGQYGFTATRQYWVTGGPWGYPNFPVCYDWATDAACAGFSTAAVVGIVRYTIAADPTNANCMWTNGDNGRLSSFDALTGSLGCPGPDPTVRFDYSVTVPRMSCAEAGRVRSYGDLTLTAPNTVTLTNLSVSVFDSDGAAVPGFTDLHPDAAGVVDLSTLSVATTGTRPAVEVTSPSTSAADARAITAAVRYASDPPQLCLTLTEQRDCPALSPGVSPNSSLPLPDATVSAASTATIDGEDTATPLSQTVSRADMTGCLGAVTGTLTRTYTGGTAPLAGRTVTLRNPDDTVAATTTSAVDGTYTISNVNPATYTVEFGDQSASKTVTGNATQTADFSLAVENPTARAVSTSTLQNTPATLAVDATADPATAIDPALTRIQDPDTEDWVSTLVVPGEGTWVVTVNGSLRFTPEAAFVGTATPVWYRVSDGYGTTATATAVVAVLPVLPTAANVTVTGVRGDTLRITPSGTGTAVPLNPVLTRLIDPNTDLPVPGLAVPGVGTFVLDGSTGEVVFTPVGTFSGSRSLVFQVTDDAGRTARATLTVTLIPFTVTGATRTIAVNQTAQVMVGGVPAHSTVTAPAAVNGAGVTVAGAVVVVVPPANRSGVFTVPATVTHGTATVTVQLIVNVVPRAVTGWYGLLDAFDTGVHWSASPGATGYQMFANGHGMCSTTGLSCTIQDPIGPRTRITVIVLGDDGLRADPVTMVYRSTGCKVVGSVYFNPDSAALSRFAVATLNNYVRLLSTQGFRKICLAGHTDNQGSQAYNLGLSKRRVTGTGSYIGARLHGLAVIRTYRGEDDPGNSNGTPQGRARNRRVDLGLN